MKIFLVVKVLDVNYNPHTAKTVIAQFEGTDPRAGGFNLKPVQGTGVYEIEIPDFVDLFGVNVDEPGFYPVHQQLKLVRTGATPSLQYSANFQEVNIRNIGGNSRGSDFNVEVHVVLGQLKNCRDIVEVIARRFPPNGKPAILSIDPMTRPVIDFTGLTVLDRGPTGWNSFIHNMIPAVAPQGRMFYIERVEIPRLIAVYVPNGVLVTRERDKVDPLKKPIDFHIFYHPSPGVLGGAYPYSFSFIDLICRYLFYCRILHKEMTNQHEASGKKPVFVFPVGNPSVWMDRFGNQTSLLRLLQELAYYIQRKDRIPYPLQGVGHCAVSGFSAGGALVRQALGGDNPFFHNNVLREIYGFDLRQEGGSSFASTLSSWWRKGADERRFRIYTTDDSQWNACQNIDSAAVLTQGSGSSLEKTGPQSTVVFLPTPFWVKLDPQNPPSGSYQVFRPVFDDIHQMMPALFMQHALKNSAF